MQRRLIGFPVAEPGVVVCSPVDLGRCGGWALARRRARRNSLREPEVPVAGVRSCSEAAGVGPPAALSARNRR